MQWLERSLWYINMQRQKNDAWTDSYVFPSQANDIFFNILGAWLSAWKQMSFISSDRNLINVGQILQGRGIWAFWLNRRTGSKDMKLDFQPEATRHQFSLVSWVIMEMSNLGIWDCLLALRLQNVWLPPSCSYRLLLSCLSQHLFPALPLSNYELKNNVSSYF